MRAQCSCACAEIQTLQFAACACAEIQTLQLLYSSILNNSILMIISYDQSWATANLKIASLPLFAGNNSDATPPVSEQK